MLHKHMGGWPWDNENVSKLPLWRKAKHFPWKPAVSWAACAGMLIVNVSWRAIFLTRQAQRVGGSGGHAGGRYWVAEIQAYSDIHHWRLRTWGEGGEEKQQKVDNVHPKRRERAREEEEEAKRGAEVTARFSYPIIIARPSLLLSSPPVLSFLLF